MKTVGKTTAAARTRKASRSGGTVIASKSSVNPQSEHATRSIHPMDTLLVGQLETLLQEEQALQDRYSCINSASNSVELRMAFSEELAELKDRADRLYRLVSEMDHYAPCPASNSYAAIAA